MYLETLYFNVPWAVEGDCPRCGYPVTLRPPGTWKDDVVRQVCDNCDEDYRVHANEVTQTDEMTYVITQNGGVLP